MTDHPNEPLIPSGLGGFYLGNLLCITELTFCVGNVFLLFVDGYDANLIYMNNDQLKHIVTVLHAVAVGLFAVFGYAGLMAKPAEWLQIGFAALGFLNIECLAIWVLSYIRNEED